MQYNSLLYTCNSYYIRLALKQLKTAKTAQSSQLTLQAVSQHVYIKGTFPSFLLFSFLFSLVSSISAIYKADYSRLLYVPSQYKCDSSSAQLAALYRLRLRLLCPTTAFAWSNILTIDTVSAIRSCVNYTKQSVQLSIPCGPKLQLGDEQFVFS